MIFSTIEQRTSAELHTSASTSGTSIGKVVKPYQTARITVFPFPEETASYPWTLDSGLAHLQDRTTNGFFDASRLVVQTNSISVPSSLGELRRLSGLTWEQLARLFNVSRRSVHFWASGKPISRFNEETISKLLDTLRYIDRGSASENRKLLLRSFGNGVVPFDLLVAGKYEDVKAMLGHEDISKQTQLAPIDECEQTLYNPQKPEELIGALHDPVHKDVGQARPARSVRLSKCDREE
ncbi:MAG: helix-turn-helix transcriptional regulator [Cyanobacteria bacterium J06629_9]